MRTTVMVIFSGYSNQLAEMATAMAEKPRKVVKTEDRSGRRTAPVQVEKDLARMAAVIASHDGITQSDLVSPLLRPFLEGEYARVQESIRRELQGKKQA